MPICMDKVLGDALEVSCVNGIQSGDANDQGTNEACKEASGCIYVHGNLFGLLVPEIRYLIHGRVSS